ncbi:hypothetical protein [Nocardia wallacei]|uniref:hypothetical protein n=1 Tax=Nocardia wallacei TaxID=480035 RepID=UPI002457D6FC|nr:hypothetical protein [Nocardia wallacei]
MSITVKQMDPAVLARANSNLSRRNLTLNGLVVATFEALLADSRVVLDFLAPDWPAPVRRGRPPVHREPSMSSSQLREGVRTLLSARGLEVADFEWAARASLLADPDRMLQVLSSNWPASPSA